MTSAPAGTQLTEAQRARVSQLREALPLWQTTVRSRDGAIGLVWIVRPGWRDVVLYVHPSGVLTLAPTPAADGLDVIVMHDEPPDLAAEGVRLQLSALTGRSA